MEYSSATETSVCNLASIALPAFVKDKAFDFDEFRRVVGVVTRNLDRVVDITYYPVPEARRSNLRHRPLGLGVQGLADVLAVLEYSWDSVEAADINRRIFENLYYAAITTSISLARELGPYETFDGSPASRGILQFDMWDDARVDAGFDWDKIKADMKTYGLRNSLLVAPMPTASTAIILGNNESTEPFTSNLYVRRTLTGEFTMVNRHLVKELSRLGLWNKRTKDQIIADNGSIQQIHGVPAKTKDVFKTVWEIGQRTLIDMAKERGVFICQSQSFNVYVRAPTFKKLSSMWFYVWKSGLKGTYYLHSRPAADAIKFTIDPSREQECLTCSS